MARLIVDVESPDSTSECLNLGSDSGMTSAAARVALPDILDPLYALTHE